jgi:hypothetical protein
MADTVKLDIALRSSNDAFEDIDQAALEVAGILHEVANDLTRSAETSYSEGNLRDTNGNTVGSFKYEYTPE